MTIPDEAQNVIDTRKALEDGMEHLAWEHFWPKPWHFDEEGHVGGPCVKDANGSVICAFFWPGHPAGQTENAERATYALGKFVSRLVEPFLSLWPNVEWRDAKPAIGSQYILAGMLHVGSIDKCYDEFDNISVEAKAPWIASIRTLDGMNRLPGTFPSPELAKGAVEAEFKKAISPPGMEKA